jgi:putative peptidoglycan lipid II flippase
MTHSSSDKQMLRSSMIVIILQMVGVIVAYIREMAVARQFGSQTQVDQYYVAFTIVTLLPNIVWSVGWASFVPIFMRRWINDREAAWNVANIVLSYALLFLVAGSIVTSTFAGTWIRLVAPGLTPEAMDASRQLMYVLLPVLVLMGINVQLMAVLNGLKLFGVATLSQVLPSFFSLAAVLIFPAHVGIFSLAWGWTAGSLAQTVVLLWQCQRVGYRFHFDLKISQDLREFGSGVLTYLLPASSYLVITLVDRHYASRLGTGAIAVLNYGDKIFRIPMVVVTTSLFTVSLSYFSEHAAAEDFAKFRESLSVGIRFAAFLLFPIALFMLILHDPIVSIAYQHGAFTLQDTIRVAATLVAYAPLVVVHGVWFVLERSMIALGRMKLLSVISIVMIVVKVVSSAALYRQLGVPGLVISTVVTFLIALIAMYWVILKQFGRSAARSEVASIGYLLPALAGSGLVGLALRGALARNGWLPTNFFSSAMILGIAGSGAIVSFLLLAFAIRNPELVLVGRWLHSRVMREMVAV